MNFNEKFLENLSLGINLKVFFKDDDPHFIGNEVAKGLEFTHPREAVRDNIKGKNKMTLKEFCRDLPQEKRSEILSKLHPNTIIINEIAFYKFCVRSNSDKMESFQEWVFNTIRDIRKGFILSIRKLSPDNPVEIIKQLILKIPKHNREGNNSLRKSMCKLFKEAYDLSKNPYCVRSGRKGGKETQKRIREIKDSFDKLKRKIERQIEKIESDIEETLRQISSSENERSSSEDEY